MGHQDSVFMRTFIIIFAILVVFALAMYGIARSITAGNQSSVGDPQKLQNIKRVSAVSVAGATPVSTSGNAKSPEEIGNACFACHAKGVGGAPKVGNKGDWAARAKTGLNTMVKVVIDGKGIMPKRGGTSLSDDEIKSVVQHMLKKSGL